MSASDDDIAPDAVVVITGAGSGIGRLLALDLSRSGANLAICGRRHGPLLETQAMALDAGAGSVHVRALDVRDGDAVSAFADDVADRLGPATGCVNNAGALGPVGAITDVALDEWASALATNVVGAANVTAAFARQMAPSGAGSIVNLAGGGVGGPGIASRVSAYTASKSAIVSLSETWAAELSPIRVNALAPGAIGTSFNDPIVDAGPELAGSELYGQTVRQRDDPVAAEPFLALVRWLLGVRSSWLTGRLVSARWESVGSLEAQREQITVGSRFRLRRIDEAMYAEIETEGT